MNAERENQSFWGVFSCQAIDTTPGANDPFAPPKEWDGDDASYIDLLRRRYKHLATRQRMYLSAKAYVYHPYDMCIEGPYADILPGVLEKIIRWRVKPRPSRAGI